MNILQEHGSLVRKIGLILISFFVLQLLLGVFLIYQVAIKQTTEYLYQTAKRVREDISYKNGSWNTSRYNADPNLPNTYPLYVLSVDGFVIERWKPLKGFLDTSDSKHLLVYKKPQTVKTPTNQTWRMLSKPVIHRNETIGVITVASFDPHSEQMEDIDKSLYESLSTIYSRLSIKNGIIDTHNLDVRDISFDISFQVVDKFNKIIAKNNNNNSIDRIPNYIDASYIGNVISVEPIRQIRDSHTKEKFLLVSTPIVDANDVVVGVIVIGRSIAYIDQVLENFILAEGCVGIILVCIFLWLTIRLIRPELVKLSNSKESIKKEINHISFDKKKGLLLLDENEIIIHYATNQYYLCEALFSAPKKRWEIDELLEKFGEQDLTNWRKVYDAMLILNKKLTQIADIKLIIVRDKTYQINPVLLHKII